MDLTVIGSGRWGSFLAYYLNSLGHRVTLCGREGSARFEALCQSRANDLLTLPPEIRLTTDLREAAQNEILLISVASQGLRALGERLGALGLTDRTLVLCMKGLEEGSGLRLSEVISSCLEPSDTVAVWLGPGHVQEFIRGVPNCMVIDSASQEAKGRLVDLFSGPLIRFYYGTDLIGNEIGAASKNVIGIAAGMLDGFGLSTLKGALMSRGTREIARLIRAMGGNELSAYGLCHLGDYEATVFSPYSHNRRFGECFVRGEPYRELAEGYFTVKALTRLEETYGAELPICRAVYRILYENASAENELHTLFGRSLKREF